MTQDELDDEDELDDQDERMVAWYQEVWPPVYKKGLAKGLGALSPKDQILFLIGYLFNQLCDGGALFVYYNPSAKYVISMAEALEKIGARRAAQVMRDINQYFPGGRPSEDHDVREKQLETLPKEASEKGAELDRIFEEWLPGNGGRVMLKQLYDHCHLAENWTQYPPNSSMASSCQVGAPVLCSESFSQLTELRRDETRSELRVDGG